MSAYETLFRLGAMFLDATMKVLVIDTQEGTDGEHLLTATVEADTSAIPLSAALTRLRDQWNSAPGEIARDRLVAKMTKAQTPTTAWHAIIESLERETAFKIAGLKETIQLTMEKETDEAKATSSPSIHDPIPKLMTVSRGKRLLEENARQSAVEQIQNEVQSGGQRVLVLVDMGNGNARHTSRTTLPVLIQGFSKCMNGEKFGFVDCSQCDVTMTSAKNLNNHVGGRLPCGTPFCLGYREAEAAVEAGEMTENTWPRDTTNGYRA
mmetsp:Transcript_35433/g.88637  ORF Transcript_35433/g.88637 Transcript_35433/m.88637 type:complete len:266 (-) Transcript_35433:42-839(-)